MIDREEALKATRMIIGNGMHLRALGNVDALPEGVRAPTMGEIEKQVVDAILVGQVSLGEYLCMKLSRFVFIERRRLKQRIRWLESEQQKAGPIQTRLNIVLNAIPQEILEDYGVDIPFVYGKS